MFFPYPEIRVVQDAFIKLIEKAVQERKSLIVEAPTGLGKTAACLSVLLEEGLNKQKKVFFLTNRSTQHQIVLQTIREIEEKYQKGIMAINFIGKKSMCSQPKTERLPSHLFSEFCESLVKDEKCEFYLNTKRKNNLPALIAEKVIGKIEKEKIKVLDAEKINSLSKEEALCPYELASFLTQKANLIIADYNYLFSPIKNIFLAKINTKIEDCILIIDEAHNLAKRITENLSSKISNLFLERAGKEAEKFYPSLKEIIVKVSNALEEMNQKNKDLKEGEKESLVSEEEFVDSLNQKLKEFGFDYSLLIEELYLAADLIRRKQKRSYLGRLANFLDNWLQEEEGFLRYVEERRKGEERIIFLHHDCLDPSLISQLVFSQSYFNLLMSATLKPTFMYKDILAVPSPWEKAYPSPFPKENRLNLVVPQTTTKYPLRNEEMFKKIAQHCQEINSLIPKNCFFFFPSYQLRDKVYSYFDKESNSKEIILEKSELTKEERIKILRRFKEEENLSLWGTIAGNFAEGVDLPGCLQAIIIVGIPLTKPDLKTSKTIEYYQKKFGLGYEYGYLYPAFNKCRQAAGRCIRSSQDRGVVVFLDYRFIWPRYFELLPKENTLVTNDYAKEIKRFFGNDF